MSEAPPSLDLRPDHWDIVRGILRRHVPGRKVLAFGSRATWTAKEYSDLDLAVLGDKPLPLDVASALAESFVESDLPFKVDVVDWASTSESFRKVIERDYVVLVEKEERGGVDEWREARWGDIAILEYGRALRGYNAAQGPFRVFGTNGPIGWHDEALCEHEGVIVGRKGAYRGIHYSPAPFFAIDTAFYLKPKVEMDVRWAYYTLLTQDINGMDSGSAIPSTSREEFYGLPVSVPPLPEQRAIAHTLGTLDDKIELNRRMNETLEAMARALFKSWFFDFDPVRAKMEGRDTGLPKHISDLFPDRLVDSELGDIPEGWQYGTIHDIASLNPESWSATNRPEELIYVDLANTKWGYIESVRTFLWDKAPSRARRVLRKGDTIIATVRPGNGSFALIDEDGLTGSTGFTVLRPHETTDRELVWCAGTSSENIDRLSYLADGGAYPAIRPDAVGATPVVLVAPATRKAFSRLVYPLLDKIEANKRESRVLAALRDTLLPKLMSGELRVLDTSQNMSPHT